MPILMDYTAMSTATSTTTAGTNNVSRTVGGGAKYIFDSVMNADAKKSLDNSLELIINGSEMLSSSSKKMTSSQSRHKQQTTLSQSKYNAASNISSNVPS